MGSKPAAFIALRDLAIVFVETLTTSAHEGFEILAALFAGFALLGAGVTSAPATRTAPVASWCWWLEVETVTHCDAAIGLGWASFLGVEQPAPLSACRRERQFQMPTV